MEVWQLAAVIGAAALAAAALARLLWGLLAARRRAAGNAAAKPHAARQVPVQRGALPHSPPLQRPGETGRQGQDSACPLQELIAGVDQKVREIRKQRDASAPCPTAAPSPEGPRQAEVIRLSRQGLDAVEIARRVRLNVGEVELIVNLHRCGRGTDGQPGAAR